MNSSNESIANTNSVFSTGKFEQNSGNYLRQGGQRVKCCTSVRQAPQIAEPMGKDDTECATREDKVGQVGEAKLVKAKAGWSAISDKDQPEKRQ
eukprot:314220-Amphidinium_carterae.1